MDKVTQHLDNLTGRIPALAGVRQDILDAYTCMEQTFAEGGVLLCAGNGGSHADAEHIVGELMKNFHLPRHLTEDERAALMAVDGERGARLGKVLRGALPTISLGSGVALLSAFANDVDGAAAFAQQVHGYGRAGDALLVITTSGNSENILLAAVAGRAKGLKVIGLTGRSGGELKRYADVCICVPETQVDIVQELHAPVYHCLCGMLETRFFG